MKLTPRKRRAAAVLGSLAVTTAVSLAAVQSLSAAPTQGTGTAASKATPKPSASSCGNCNGNSGNGAGNGGGDGSLSENKSFAISGSVVGLAPGVPSVIRLTLVNGAPQPMRVSSLSVQASDVRSAGGALRCAATTLLLGDPRTAGSGSISTSLVVAANGSSDVLFPVVLAATATDSCKDVTWQLAYSGTGAQA